MRILIDYRPALWERTGVGGYAHELATALLRRLPTEHRLALFSSSWKDRLDPNAVPGAEIVDARVPVRILNLAWHRLGWPSVERLTGAVDVAHSMHPLLIPARSAAQVVTIHDLYFLDRPADTRAEIRRDYPVLAARHAQRADAIITNSHYTAAQVQARLEVPAERITVCAPGAPRWPPRPRGIRGGAILFIGTLEPRKNPGALIGAYRRLRERLSDAPPLIVAGRVPPESAALARELKTLPRTRVVGYVSDDERRRLFQEASMLIVPSLDEGFGMPALEAMTVGLPVVAANRGALPEVLQEAGLLVDPTDEDALAESMKRVLCDSALATQLSESGIERARGFSWDVSAGHLLNAYAQAIARRRSRS